MDLSRIWTIYTILNITQYQAAHFHWVYNIFHTPTVSVDGMSMKEPIWSISCFFFLFFLLYCVSLHQLPPPHGHPPLPAPLALSFGECWCKLRRSIIPEQNSEMNGTRINRNQLFKVLSMFTWVGEVSINLYKCQNMNSPVCTQVNLMYICASLFTLVYLAVLKTVNLFSPEIIWKLMISTPLSYKEIQS